MLDPRIDLANMLHELREKLNHIEMKLWEIPHHQEPVEEYEAVFTAPVQGDYLHPLTPTHEKPEAFSDAAYWDECTQCWMEPTTWEWDTYNYCDNANANVSYECESNTWVEGNDWSNDYASEWHDYEANTVFVEEDHGQEANAEMPVMEPVSTEPELDADGFVLETEAPMTEAPEMEMAPEMAPAPEMEPMPETEPMPEIPATDMDQDDTNPPS
jgi:hypothetical protein